jgi:hypothetical protein
LRSAVEQPDAATGYTATVQFVDDRAFEGLTPDEMKSLMPDDPDGPFVSFIADEEALTSDGWPVLAVWVLPPDDEIDDSEYAPFRVTASQLGTVEANLNLANLDWDDFARSVDDDGVFRGFE